MDDKKAYAAFVEDALLKSGPLTEVLAAVKLALDGGETRSILIFDNGTGSQVDFDFRGSLDDVLERATPKQAPRGRGRPKLGVEAREVTLLPRHWAWLQQQPNGASAALRRLVEETMRIKKPENEIRRMRNAAYAFMSAMAGDNVGFEEASRALFAGDVAGVENITKAWPTDIRAHLNHLLGDARAGADAD
jgi:hypothetical protein